MKKGPGAIQKYTKKLRGINPLGMSSKTCLTHRPSYCPNRGWFWKELL